MEEEHLYDAHINIKLLYDNYKQQFMNYYKGVIDKNILEDIYHDSWEAICIKMSKNEIQIPKLGNYLLTICKNKVYNLFKEKKNIRLDEISLSNDDYAMLLLKDEDELEEALSIVSDVMDKADDKCKKIFNLFFTQKKNMEEIAKEMGYNSKDVAKRRKYLCKQAFAKAMVKKLGTIGINWRIKK